MQQIKIERRLPMGFMGDWGKLYKRYVFEDELYVDYQNEAIAHEGSNYVDIGQDVQFKRADDAKWEIKQEIKGLMGNVQYILVKTTDAYFDNETRQYECVIAPLDLVKVFGKLWTVEKIVTKVRQAPAPLKFFYIALTSMEDDKKNE